MKIRSGFVSNSSSSSFVIFGTQLTSLDEVMNCQKPIICIGKTLNEGRDVFKLTPEMKSALSTSNYDYWLTFITDYVEISEESFNRPLIKRESLPEEFQVFSGEADYYCTNTIKAFLETYISTK